MREKERKREKNERERERESLVERKKPDIYIQYRNIKEKYKI